jgi:hypothetical protein
MRVGGTLAIATALLVTSAVIAGAEKVLKSEPPEGYLHPGERVLVDDGACPGGQIKDVVGGSNRKYRTSIPRSGAERTAKCIPR